MDREIRHVITESCAKLQNQELSKELWEFVVWTGALDESSSPPNFVLFQALLSTRQWLWYDWYDVGLAGATATINGQRFIIATLGN